jgi:hypothetical protein
MFSILRFTFYVLRDGADQPYGPGFAYFPADKNEEELRGGDDESSVGDESEGYIEDSDAFRDVLIFEA